ncbi:endonuclease/exonuclease/phosphatase family protein [Rhodobacteraceae bacterium CCMM004]|nr:endonuclease/exonuclease/phosphatase family protein [Rhodobacteraceae bacterium CCMM004]
MALTAVAYALTAFFAAVCILPLTGSHKWWIRAMDFPRVHYLLVLGPTAAFVAWAAPPGRWALLALLAAAFVYQAWRIWPYTPLHGKEIRFAAENSGSPAPVIEAMASNVLMENEDHEAVLAVLRDRDPDIAFFMETNDRWAEALKPALDRYPHVTWHPKDDYYGLIFATRLKVREMDIRYLTVEETPTLFAELEDAQGTVFRFVGMHPKPPTPGVDTEERDDQLYYSARFARDSTVPVVIMGDFNAVAWSHPAHKFKRIGEYLDPRIGRGPLPSFDATSRLMRFPIDQLYITPDIALLSFSRGPEVGSDHFPMFARFRMDKGEAARLNARPWVPPDDYRATTEARVARYRERLQLTRSDDT